MKAAEFLRAWEKSKKQQSKMSTQHGYIVLKNAPLQNTEWFPAGYFIGSTEQQSTEYNEDKKRLLELEVISKKYFGKYDALISPTTIMQALNVNETIDIEKMHERSLLASSNTQPVDMTSPDKKGERQNLVSMKLVELKRNFFWLSLVS